MTSVGLPCSIHGGGLTVYTFVEEEGQREAGRGGKRSEEEVN